MGNGREEDPETECLPRAHAHLRREEYLLLEERGWGTGKEGVWADCPLFFFHRFLISCMLASTFDRMELFGVLFLLRWVSPLSGSLFDAFTCVLLVVLV